MLAAALVLLLQVRVVTFEHPVKINREQVMLFTRRAQEVRELTRKTTLQLSATEKERNFSEFKDTLRRSVSVASNAVKMTSSVFTELSTNEEQKQAARVFFGDLTNLYTDVSEKISTLQPSDPSGYTTLRDATLWVLDHNALAYEVVARTELETFDLDVKSFPQDAVVSYRRRGDNYRVDDQTDTTLRNLACAIWIIRVHKDGFQDQEKEHDPFRNSNHVVFFQLKRK